MMVIIIQLGFVELNYPLGGLLKGLFKVQVKDLLTRYTKGLGFIRALCCKRENSYKIYKNFKRQRDRDRKRVQERGKRGDREREIEIERDREIDREKQIEKNRQRDREKEIEIQR